MFQYLIVAATLLTALFPAFLSTSAFAAGVIESVEVRGNRKIESAAILTKIRSQKGSRFNTDLVREDIRSVFGLGYFDHIQVEEEAVSGGVKLIFQVREKATISKIEYKGLEEIDEDETKDIVQVKQYEVLDIHKLNQSVEKFVAKYEEKGFYLADVRYEIQLDEKKNEATVTFHVQENDKVQVKSINIIGNKIIPADDLKAVMQTKEGGALSFLTSSGSYREALFERDMAALSFYYGTLGYVRARFGKPEVAVSADKKWIYITFSVEEGNQYSVGTIDFNGELLFTRSELMDDIKLVTGETFNTETLRRETLRYTDKYSDLGYAFANVVPQPVIHDDTRKVDVVFEIDKGERVYVGKIYVTGNTRTKDKVVRRELKIREGELFSGTLKRESREGVLRLGFFDSVEFHQTTSKTSPNVVDIEVRVKERSTGQLVIGAGYASGEAGFTAQAQLSQNNFLGSGQVASFSALLQTGKGGHYEYNLGFHEPYVGYSDWSLGGDLYQVRRKLYSGLSVETFDEVRTGFDVKLGHPILEYTHLFLTYKLENSYVNEATIIDKSIIPPDSVNGFTSSVTGSVVVDKRDDRFEPRHGWYSSLAAEYAGLGGARKFFKSLANVKYFHPIVWDFIFRLNVQGGNITQVGDGQVPINELFIQGGLPSLRGYRPLSIGPKRPLSPITGPGSENLSENARKPENNLSGKEIVIGGHNQVLANVEIEFPILKDARLKGVIFFDAGNAFDGSLSALSPALYANYGWGIRWFTPIGPLRFEFGYPIVNPGSPEFVFMIGPAF